MISKTKGVKMMVMLGIFILSLMFTSSAGADFSETSISLVEGDAITIAYTTDRFVRFELEPLYSFENYQDAISVQPETLSENGDITISLIDLLHQENVISDNYTFLLNAIDNENDLVSILIIYAYIENDIAPEPTIDPDILENLVTKEAYENFKRTVTGWFNELYASLYEDNSDALLYEMYENLENLITVALEEQDDRMTEQDAVIEKQDEEINRLSSQLGIFIAIFVSIVVIATVGLTFKLVSRTKPEVRKSMTSEQLQEIQHKLGKGVKKPPIRKKK